MAEFSRTVEVEWQGGIMDGRGEAKAGTGAFSLPVTFPRRIGEPEGTTSPEELVAAAHAACFAMAFNGVLGRKQAGAARTTVTAKVTAEKSDAGLKLLSSHLELVVTGLHGIDAGQLSEVASQAESGCPISNALRNNVKIEVTARAK
jgi:lipoyl-dependent peroxiredoxin